MKCRRHAIPKVLWTFCGSSFVKRPLTMRVRIDGSRSVASPPRPMLENRRLFDDDSDERPRRDLVAPMRREKERGRREGSKALATDELEALFEACEALSRR